MPDTTVAFFDSTFEEALALTREARDYLTHAEPRERERMTPNDRMLASCEAMRMTSRLTQVMAWLLVQRAVHAGEMTRDEARAPEYRLGGQSVCGEVKPPVEGTLQPPAEGAAWEYSVVLSIRNDRGEEVTRQVVGVGAMQPHEQRSFVLSVELNPATGKAATRRMRH